jgi:hypothetical protein
MTTPIRQGKPWIKDEIMQLLHRVAMKKSITEIAAEHQRSTGGITSRLQEIAADYHYENKMSMEDIKKFTGLSEEVILDAISRRKAVAEVKPKPKVKVPEKEENSELMEILVTLKDIQRMMQEFIVAAR